MYSRVLVSLMPSYSRAHVLFFIPDSMITIISSILESCSGYLLVCLLFMCRVVYGVTPPPWFSVLCFVVIFLLFVLPAWPFIKTPFLHIVHLGPPFLFHRLTPRNTQGVLGFSLQVLVSHRVCWGSHSRSWWATGCAGVLTPGPGEPQGVLGFSLQVLVSHRVCWGSHSRSWWATGCAGVLTPGPGEPQGVLGSSLLVLVSHRVCWGSHSRSWWATGCAGVLSPGPGEPQGVLAFVVTQHLIDQLKPLHEHMSSTQGG